MLSSFHNEAENMIGMFMKVYNFNSLLENILRIFHFVDSFCDKQFFFIKITVPSF